MWPKRFSSCLIHCCFATFRLRPLRNAATLRKVLAPFSFSHVIDPFPLFSFSFLSRSFLIFMVTSDRVLNQMRFRIAYNFKFQWK